MLVSNGGLVKKSPTVIWQGDTAHYYGAWTPQSGYVTSGYAELYKRQLWVYVVVAKRARGVARLPLKVYLRDDLNRPDAGDHPYAVLLRNPNPRMSPFRFWEWTASTYDVFGEAMWLKVRDAGGRPYQLLPLHPTALTREDDGTWTFRNGSVDVTGIPAADVVHFKTYNPSDPNRGLSALEPLRDTLENEGNARVATSSFWRNGARPGVALSHPGTLSQAAADRLKMQWDSIAGGSARTGSTVVLEEGMTPQVMTLSAEEAQYIETRKLNREEVCGAFDVPPPVVHILDHATYSNITEQMRSMYRDTMAPILKGFESDMETQLRMPDFGGEVYAEFLLDEVLRGDFEARSEAYSKAEYLTIAEKRRAENLPYIDGTDRIFMNAANVPMPAAPKDDDVQAAPQFQQVGLPALIAAGVINPQDARTLLQIAGTAPGLPALPAEAVRSVMGRLSRQKTLAEVDANILIGGVTLIDGLTVWAELADARDAGESIAQFRDRIKSLTKETP